MFVLLFLSDFHVGVVKIICVKRLASDLFLALLFIPHIQKSHEPYMPCNYYRESISIYGCPSFKYIQQADLDILLPIEFQAR